MNEPSVTQEDVHAAGAGVSEADVAKANAQPAHTDALEAFMQAMGARMRQVEAVLGLVEPAVNEAAGLAGLVVPQAAPVLEKLPAIETAVNDLSARVDDIAAAGTLKAPVADRVAGVTAAVGSLAATLAATLGALHAAFADHPSLPASLPKPGAAARASTTGN